MRVTGIGNEGHICSCALECFVKACDVIKARVPVADGEHQGRRDLVRSIERRDSAVKIERILWTTAAKKGSDEIGRCRTFAIPHEPVCDSRAGYCGPKDIRFRQQLINCCGTVAVAVKEHSVRV